MKYKHTQIGYVVLTSFVVLFGFIYFMTKTATPDLGLVINSVSYVFLLLVVLFCCLTVSVDDRYLMASFGIGLFRRKILLSEIKSAETTKNKWYYGWGIRYLGTDGWMFNISGLDAVKLELKNGKKFRIGTDEPAKLVAALKSSMSK